MKKQGFTLVEVLVALAVVSILIVAIFNMVFAIVKNTKLNTEKQNARLVAQETIEQIKAIEVMKTQYLPNGVKMDKENEKINGTVNGFTVEGTVKVSDDEKNENTELLNKPISSIIDLKKSGYIYKDSKTIKEYLSQTSSTNRTNIISLDLKFDTSYIYINDRRIQRFNSKDPLVVFIREDLSNKAIEVSIENKTDDKSNIYFIADGNFDVGNSYTIADLNGKVSLYNNKIYSNEIQKGIYSIELKVKKGNVVLQAVNAQKSIK